MSGVSEGFLKTHSNRSKQYLSDITNNNSTTVKPPIVDPPR